MTQVQQNFEEVVKEIDGKIFTTTTHCRSCGQLLREEIPGVFGNIKIGRFGSFCTFQCVEEWKNEQI